MQSNTTALSRVVNYGVAPCIWVGSLEKFLLHLKTFYWLVSLQVDLFKTW